MMVGGVMKERQGDLYTIRVLSIGGRVEAEHLKCIAAFAEQFGAGFVHLTVRQTIEIPNVPANKLDALLSALTDAGIELGLTGRRVRGITACPGAPRCRYSQADAQGMALQLHRRLGRRDGLPAKFKIGVSGCPNGCTKPIENDLGVVGLARGFRLLVGGKMGKRPRLGTPLPIEVLTSEAVLVAADRIIDWYAAYGQEKERLGDLVDRMGIDHLAKFITGGKSGFSAERPG